MINLLFGVVCFRIAQPRRRPRRYARHRSAGEAALRRSQKYDFRMITPLDAGIFSGGGFYDAPLPYAGRAFAARRLTTHAGADVEGNGHHRFLHLHAARNTAAHTLSLCGISTAYIGRSGCGATAPWSASNDKSRFYLPINGCILKDLTFNPKQKYVYFKIYPNISTKKYPPAGKSRNATKLNEILNFLQNKKCHASPVTAGPHP